MIEKACAEIIESRGLSKHVGKQFMARVSLAHKRLYNLSLYENNLYDRLQRKSPKKTIWSVPRVPNEVHDIHALHRVGKYLLDA